MPEIHEMSNERDALLGRTRAILDKAEKENRNLNPTEEKEYDDLFSQATDLKAEIDTAHKTVQRRADQAEAERDLRTPRPTSAAGAEGSGGVVKTDRLLTNEEYRKAFGAWLARGKAGLTQEQSGVVNKVMAALQSDLDVSGGYLVAPEQMVQQLLKSLDDDVVIRGLATTFQVTQAAALGVPSLDADPDDADWTSELATGSEDTAMAFGKRELHPHPLAKRIKISNKLLRSGFLDVEGLVRERLGYKFRITHEKAFITGTGANQPLGIFTASDDGIPTSRDVSTDNTTTAITFDGLKEAKYSLKEGYRNRARWLFHRDAVKMISKLKDGNGQYLWSDSVRVGDPDTIMGIPVMTSEYVPNTFTTGLYVGALADFSFYWIVDALSMQMQRLVELYAETNQTGLIGRLETDAQPVLAEAFTRVKLS